MLAASVEDGDILGVAWGTTTSAIAAHLRPRELHGVTVIGLNGGANHQTTGLPYVGSILHRFAEAFNGQEQLLALPAFFDNPDTRDAMWREQSTRHILSVRDNCGIALFGVGGLNSELQSHVYASNYLSERDQRELREMGVVGDICTVMLREDGSFRDIPLNGRATGMTPKELQRVPAASAW
nr:sugar-binding domain-containing protein [Tessaracoccus coleopterorum]